MLLKYHFDNVPNLWSSRGNLLMLPHSCDPPCEGNDSWPPQTPDATLTNTDDDEHHGEIAAGT